MNGNKDGVTIPRIEYRGIHQPRWSWIRKGWWRMCHSSISGYETSNVRERLRKESRLEGLEKGVDNVILRKVIQWEQ